MPASNRSCAAESAQIINVYVDVTLMRIAVLAALRLVIHQSAGMAVWNFCPLIGKGDPAVAQRVWRPFLGEQLRLGGGQTLLLKVAGLPT